MDGGGLGLDERGVSSDACSGSSALSLLMGVCMCVCVCVNVSCCLLRINKMRSGPSELV